MRIICISDTHGRHREMKFPIPDGDVLIHAGDLTHNGTVKTMDDFDLWLGELPHKVKIFVGGNHDYAINNNPEKMIDHFKNATLLHNSYITIDGVTFYGASWKNFRSRSKESREEMKNHWEHIPTNTDVLITHTPAMNILDLTYDDDSAGCEDLKNKIIEVEPKLHVHGHIHESYGLIERGLTTHLNASICNRRNQPIYKPLIFDL